MALALPQEKVQLHLSVPTRLLIENTSSRGEAVSHPPLTTAFPAPQVASTWTVYGGVTLSQLDPLEYSVNDTVALPVGPVGPVGP